MKDVHKHLLVAACLAVLGLSAGAQTPAPQGPGAAPGPMMTMPAQPGMHEQHRAHMQQRMAQREAALKQILQITPAQENAWNAWTAARRPAGNIQRPDRSALAQLPTPERIDRLRALRTARNAEMDRRGESTKTFYAALTASQQKAFDALTAHRIERGMGRGHGGWGRHHG